MAQETKNVKGIVLKTYDYSDSSRIVDVFTLELGRISFLARGAKRNKSKFLNLTQSFVEASFNLVEGKSMWYIKDGLLKDAHLGLRKTLAHLSCASFAGELVASVLVRDREEDLFFLLQSVLGAIEGANQDKLSQVMAAFCLKAASFLGFRPTLSRCAECGARLDHLFFDSQAGGMVCDDHQRPGAVFLSREDYEQMTRFIRLPLAEVADLEAEVDWPRLNRLCTAYFLYHTGSKPPKSMTMIQELGIL